MTSPIAGGAPGYRSSSHNDHQVGDLDRYPDSSGRVTDPRIRDSSLLVVAAYALAVAGVAAYLVDRPLSKAFRYAELAIDDERIYGRGIR